MTLDFKAALLYPFRAENRKQTLWIPGAGLWVILIVAVLLGVFTALITGDPDSAKGYNSLLQIILNLLFGGYLWRAIGQWQNDGPGATAPGWLDNFRELVLDGLKITLYYFLLGLIMVPMVLLFVLAIIIVAALSGGSALTAPDHFNPGLMLGLIFVGFCLFVGFQILAGPFIWAPIVYSAPDRRLADLFRFIRAWKRAWANYPEALMAMLYMIPMSLLYLIGMMALALTIVGFLAIPLILLPFQISMAHLIYQALDKEPASETAS